MYDEHWLKDFIVQEMSLWERMDIVRFYESYSVEGAFAAYQRFVNHGCFFVTLGDPDDPYRADQFTSEFLEGVSHVAIESDSVKEELLTSIEMILL